MKSWNSRSPLVAFCTQNEKRGEYISGIALQVTLAAHSQVHVETGGEAGASILLPLSLSQQPLRLASRQVLARRLARLLAARALAPRLRLQSHEGHVEDRQVRLRALRHQRASRRVRRCCIRRQ